MFESFRNWLEEVLGTQYRYVQGQWQEDDNSADDFFCSIHSTGGPAPSVDDRYPNLRVILVGPRNGRGYATKIRQDAESIMARVVSENRGVPCTLVNIRASGEPIGPGYTTENRVWYTLDFTVIL